MNTSTVRIVFLVVTAVGLLAISRSPLNTARTGAPPVAPHDVVDRSP